MMSADGGRRLSRRPDRAPSRDTGADMVTAITMNYAEEAIGIARAAKTAGMPVVDLLHPGDRRPAADRPDVERRDRRGRRARPAAAPAYYMINCAHPTHFADALERERAVDAADPRPARQRLEAQPRRARRGAPISTPAIRRNLAGEYARPARRAAAYQRARRLLRHRPPPCRGDRAGLRRLTQDARLSGGELRFTLGARRGCHIGRVRGRLPQPILWSLSGRIP